LYVGSAFRRTYDDKRKNSKCENGPRHRSRL
jgi:hypothetical protein